MKTIELPDEFLAQITKDDLLENYKELIKDCNKCEETGNSNMFFSDDIEEETQELLKYINAFKLVLNFYGVKL